MRNTVLYYTDVHMMILRTIQDSLHLMVAPSAASHVVRVVRMPTVQLRVLAPSLVALLLIGCSSGSDADLPAPRIVRIPTVQPNPSQPSAAPSDVIDATVFYTTDDGFTPKRVDVEPGGRVLFVNNSDGPIWPASNIHPTHAILPELDAKKPILPGEEWAFTFETRGFWRYHNHLTPEHGGLVVALGEDDGPPPAPLVMEIPERGFDQPTDISHQQFVDLFQDDGVMAEFIVRYGPEHTVRLLKEAEVHIDVDCHQRAHDLGRAAFEEFGPAAFALSGHECQAGSFHGATEALFAERGTVNLEQDVATICAVASNPFFRHQCVHGVGHGLMAWTTYELHDALPLCDRMPTEMDQGSCYSGVFMENVVGGLTGLMGHITQYLRDDDPHYPCDVVAEQYQAHCYFYQTSHMLKVFDRDFSKVAQACTEAPPSAHRNCFQSYGRDVGNATRKDPAAAIYYCDFAPAGANRVSCVEGAVQDRFWEQSGADDALTMCEMVENAEEQDACYWTIIVRARDVFPTPDRYDAFCGRIGEKWRHWCASVRDPEVAGF